MISKTISKGVQSILRSVYFQLLRFHKSNKMFALKVIFLVSLSFANSMNIAPFISSGNDAEIAEFPYLVSIQEVNVQICGGSLLNEKFVLSSARCFHLRRVAELVIEYGSTVVTPGQQGPRKNGIERVILHENFALGARLNDIAVAESKVPIVTGFHNTFVKLAPLGNKFRSGSASVHAGWGHIISGERTNSLQKAYLNILSYDECLVAVDGTLAPTRRNICAIGESAMCIGDLGNYAAAADCY